jgi:beta-glucanase (GH16 family)
MKKALYFLLFIFLQIQLNAQTPSGYVPNGYSLVFNDEFDLASSKAVKWTGDARNGRDIEWNQNAVIEDGVLKLKNIRLPSQQSDGRQFTAPSGQSIQSFKYGYFECRYKYATSIGFNNSFWLLANSAPLNVNDMEIDINEGVLDEGGKRENKIGIIDPTLDQVRPLILDHTNGSRSVAEYMYTPLDLSANFHTYGFEWTPDSLIFYFNGQRLLARANNLILPGSFKWVNYPMRVYLSSFNNNSYLGFDQAVNSEMVVDYIRVYQKPSQIGLPPTTGTNLIKYGDFPSYNTADYGWGIKYSWGTKGDVNNEYLSIASPTPRVNALFMPQQFINVPVTGLYDVSFRARILDNNNSSSIGLKISDNTSGYANSIITSITPLTSGASVSSLDARVNASAGTSTWKTYSYRVRLQANANALDCRIGFYLNNTQVAAVFDIDDISLEPVEATTIIKDGNFNFDFKEASVANVTDVQWAALTSWTKPSDVSVTSTTQVLEEASNRYIRKIVNSNNADFQVHISQYSGQVVSSGKYRLSFKSRAGAPSVTNLIRVLLSAESSEASSVISSISNSSTGVNFTPGNLGSLNFEPTASWADNTVDVDLVMPASKHLRISFRFLRSGTFDIDDVKLVPLSSLPLTLLSFRAIKLKDAVNLKWETTSELNVSHFDVQSSYDGLVFNSIAIVQARGNTSERNFYFYDDRTKLPINQYVYYRLNCVDNDGSNKFSGIVALKVDGLNKSQIKIYPSPVKSTLHIDLNQYENRLPVGYKIYDTNGMKILEGIISQYKDIINLEMLRPGTYIINFPNYSPIKFIKE